MTPLVWKGYKKPLEQSELYTLKPDIQSELLADEFERLWREQRQHQPITSSNEHSAEISSYQVLKKQFGKRYAVIGVFHLIQAAANISSPVIMQALLNFAVQTTNPAVTDKPPLVQGIVYAAVLFVLQLIATVALNRYFYYASVFGMRVRACLTLASYRKMMRLSVLARQRFASGQIMNIISSDLPRLEQTLIQGHYVWSGPLQIFTIRGLLISLIGVSALAGLGILLLMIPLQAGIFIQLGRLRSAVASTTDARIKLTQEFLQGMRVIKFFAWENSFLDRVMKLRIVEVAKIRFVNLWTAVLMGISTTVPILSSVIAFIVYAAVSASGGFQAPVIFSALAYFNLMRFPLFLLPSIIRLVTESRVAFKRIDAVLNAEEIEDVENAVAKSANPNLAISIKNGTFQWEVLEEEEKADKKNSGNKSAKDQDKSSQPEKKDEIAPSPEAEAGTKEGDIPMEDRPQKENIIQLKNINLEIKKGSLVAIVGPVGSGKSSILSAILGEMKKLEGDVIVNGSIGYTLQQPWIQNGTLRKNITFGHAYDEKRFNDAIEATALNKDLEWLPAGDETLLGEKGVQISGGQKARVSLARITYGHPEIALLDDPLSAVDVHVGKHLFEKCIKEALKDCTVVLVTHHLSYLRDVDNVILVKDGCICEQGTYDELMAKDGELARLVKSHVGKEKQSDEEVDQKKDTQKKDEPHKRGPLKQNKMAEEERAVGGVKREVYTSYLTAAGGWLTVILVVACSILSQGTRIGNDLWLVAWTNKTFALNDAAYSGIYFAWGIVQGFFTVLLGVIMSFAFETASKRYHEDALNGVFKTPITFFDTTPLGRIVNRFSRDTDTMDSVMPMSMQWFVSTFTGLIATLILLCIAAPYLLIALGPLLILYYFMMTLYLRTSRELKRLESISRSPVFAHFGESMTGLSTIRAYKRQHSFIGDCRDFVDTNNEAAYLQLVIQRWLGIRLEFIGGIIVFLVAFLGVFGSTTGTITAALFGVSLTYALQVTGNLNFTVRQAVEVEVNANSIERLHHYAVNLESEAPAVIVNKRPPQNWPLKGRVEVKDLEIKYSKDGDPVIKGVSFVIEPFTKTGVVGRTGAGKSTITAALFRMIEPSRGCIVVDDVNTSEIGLEDLRRRLAIIPQDPVLFSGTVRANLDPFNEYDDKSIWDVLDSVNMKPAISKLQQGLEAKVEPNGENFSTGQRQLLCLARAMLRHSRVLVMDEATANVDMESDQLIQKAIRKDFTESTIITVAHRLNTVIDYDKVLVLDRGRVVEYGAPYDLLQNRDGVFSQMVDQTGSTNATLLRQLAFEYHQKTLKPSSS